MLTLIVALDVAAGIAPLIGNYMENIVSNLSSEVPNQVRYLKNKRYPTNSLGYPGPASGQ